MTRNIMILEKNRVKWSFIRRVLAASFFFSFYLFASIDIPSFNLLFSSKRTHAVVFIHGTHGIPLSFLDFWNPRISFPFWKRVFFKKGKQIRHSEKYSLARLIATKTRSHNFFKGSAGAMQDEGLIALNSQSLALYEQGGLSQEERKTSAYHIAYAYNSFNNLFSNNSQMKYYTYGWLGLLDKQCRKQAAEKLFDELAKLKADQITLVTHSYGGALALYLAEVQEKRKQPLAIENLCMFAFPAEVETASYARSGMFKNIFSIYSDGDRVQKLDIFTTEEGATSRLLLPYMKEKNIEEQTRIFDIRLLKGNKSRFDHMSFWSLVYSKQRIEALHPLPPVVLAPLFMHLF